MSRVENRPTRPGANRLPIAFEANFPPVLSRWIAFLLIGWVFRAPGIGFAETHVLSGTTMGTTYSITVSDTDTNTDANTIPIGNQLQAIEIAVERRLAAIDRAMSNWRPDSELARFNRTSETGWMPVSADLAGVFDIANRIGDLSNGALDITVAPLVNLWGFGANGPIRSIPSAAEIEVARAQVGFRNMVVRRSSPSVRKLHPGLTADVSSLAKGYAVDRIADDLQSLGARDFLVEIGGEVRAHGRNRHGKPWRVGIQHPLELDQLTQVVALDDMGLATSGDYRRFQELDGVVYSHMIDPRTGRPVPRTVASVSVAHPECAVADAWATALCVLGPTRGLPLAEREGLAVLMIVRGKNGLTRFMTDRFKKIANGEQDGPVHP